MRKFGCGFKDRSWPAFPARHHAPRGELTIRELKKKKNTTTEGSRIPARKQMHTFLIHNELSMGFQQGIQSIQDCWIAEVGIFEEDPVPLFHSADKWAIIPLSKNGRVRKTPNHPPPHETPKSQINFQGTGGLGSVRTVRKRRGGLKISMSRCHNMGRMGGGADSSECFESQQ